MNTKISALFLMMLMALGVTGIGAAYWNHSLQVTGTFTTGTFGVDWSLHCYGHNGWKCMGIDEITGDEIWEEIATFDATYDNTVDPKMLTMTLTNGFPSLWWWIYFDIHCIGSVPAHLKNFDIEASLEDVPVGSIEDLPWLQLGVWVLWPGEPTPPHPEYPDDPEYLYAWAEEYLDGPYYTEEELFPLLEGYQMHYCDYIWFFMMFHLYEEDTVTPIISPPQDSTLDFTITFDAVQFNTP